MQKTITLINHPTKPQQRIKVAAYARVSSGKDAMLHSLSSQISYYSSLIQSEPSWEYVGVYSDEAISGTKEDRPGLQQLIADCRDGKINMILTKSISRFARNTVTLLETVRLLKALEVDIFFEEQNIHTTSAEGELMLTILASYAQEESRSVSENMKWRIRKNFQEGRPWQGTVLGYRTKNGQYVVVPEEAEIVRRIYREYLSGLGTNKIMKGLIEDKIPTRREKEWHENCIVRILKNYNYTGNLLLQKTYRVDHMNKKMMINNGELPMYHVEKAHEPIIDIETFNAVQLEMARRAEIAQRPKVAQPSYPFSKLIVCGNCGKNYRRKKTATQSVWICSTYNNLGKQYCASKQIPETTLIEITQTVAPIDEIKVIKALDNNTLEYHLKNGNVEIRTWVDRSRSESWTDEMRAQASERRRRYA